MKKRYVVLCASALIALFVTACALDGGNLVGPAGGFVFYDKGSYSDGWRYLECAPENAGEGTWDEAMQLCEDYSHGGYDGWRMPDIDELENLLDGGHGLPAFNNGVYWSSSEEGSSAKGIQNGDDPAPSGSSHSSGKVQAPALYSKSGKYWARPVRQF
ncbi:MAG: DUF1566 domain-containing protein [Spirochaetaceae bacterium]|jgi:hypothetical protein|nr:DUF1566 domain-containing protein [Spirochaetaceae bacterium]